MRASTIVMIGFAVLFGLIAVFLAQTWLNSQTEMRMKSLEANKKPQAPARTIVIATRQMRFGNELTAQAVQEVGWPNDALPAGAFARIADLINEGKRVVLTPIEPNEPILATKITGPGQRATLSALIQDGMKALTIRVNEVDGVAGFVLPGDHVDVVLTRQIEKGVAMNDVVLQNTRVLAVDQTADQRAEKPSVAKAVTLEVDVTSAQKLALAASVGTLSLVLRKAGESEPDTTRRVTLTDLGNNANVPAAESRFVTVGVTRASKKQEYSVPVEGNISGAMASAGRERAQQ